MSSIAGICRLDGQPADLELLSRVTDRLAHWGPDGASHWLHGPVAFGHGLLRTTPESADEKLPLTNDRGDLVITSDARLDNRDDLFSALGLGGASAGIVTDAELILRAYERWGETCAARLIGDFAFAVWDAGRRRLFCARDPIGVKPLYYRFDGRRFLWASEPWALLVDGAGSISPNLPLVSLYLLGRYDEPRETLFRGVFRLPPAHYMVLEAGRLREARYWDLDPGLAIRYRTDAEYAAHFLELFREAVRVRLRSQDRVGAWLSGGLDSSSIVCVARALGREGIAANSGLETFSLVFDGLPCDERRYIAEVVSQSDVQAHYVSWGGHELGESWHHPDSGYIRSFLWEEPALALAKKKGIRVMLDGIGGDDLLATGYDHLTDLTRSGRLVELVTQLRHDAAYLGTRSPASLFFRYCLRPLVPRPIKVMLRPLLRPFRGDGIPPWVDADAVRRLGVDERVRSVAPRPHFPTHAQQRIADLLRGGWNTTVALDIIGRFTARFGVEPRYPFFDRRLVEFLVAIPEEQRWRGKWPKAILRHAMSRILPEPVRTRQRKVNFTSALRLQLVERQGRIVEEFIRTSTLGELGIVRTDQLRRLFSECRAATGRENVSGAREFALMKFIWLEQVCRAAFDESGEREQ